MQFIRLTKNSLFGLVVWFSPVTTVMAQERGPLVIGWDNDRLNREASLPSSFSKIAERISPSVVRMAISREDPDSIDERSKIPTFYLDPEMEVRPRSYSFGSGIVVDQRGFILTNAHVVNQATACEVFLGELGQAIQGTVIAADDQSDLALVKIDTDQKLTPAIFTSDEPLLGDFVLALGNPEGVGMTLTKGMISAKNRSRSWQENNRRGDYLQIDAAIFPGNSGGALIDLKGRVIGINSWYLPQGYGKIGFAFPGEKAVKIAQDLWQYGFVRYGYLGVRLGEIDDERLAELELRAGTRGVVVLSVEMDLAADKCGLRAGDVILQIDDKKIWNVSEVAERIQFREVGTLVHIHVLRKGVPRTLSATLGLMPTPKLQVK